MANLIYPKYKEALLNGDVNIELDGSNVKAVLVDSADYTYSASDQFLTSIVVGGRVATSANLTSKTTTNGSFDAADFVFTAVTGDSCEILVLYIDTGVAATSRLVAFYDTGVTGLPVTPNGGDINITVNASGFFTL